MCSHDATRTHSFTCVNTGIKTWNSPNILPRRRSSTMYPRDPHHRPPSEDSSYVWESRTGYPRGRLSPDSQIQLCSEVSDTRTLPSLPPPYLSRPRWTAAGRSSGRRRRRRCRFGSGRGDRARTRRAAGLSRCSLASQPSSTGSREGQGGEKRTERGGEGGDRESLQRKSRPSPPTAPPARRRRFWVSGNINFVFAQGQSKVGGWVRGCTHPPGCLHAPAIAISREKKKN